jgi:hypothetical protein
MAKIMRLMSCAVFLLATCVSTTAQVQMPGVRAELQDKARTLGTVYLEEMMLNTCHKMFPTEAAFAAASGALKNITEDMQKSFSRDEITSLHEYVAASYARFEPMLTMNTQAFYECSQTSQYVGTQISMGIFSNQR